MINIFIFLLVLGPSFYDICEGCGRVPATPTPTSTPTPTQPSINGSVVSLACTDAEINETACLNGGSCYVLVLENDRIANCHCTKEYMGQRCQELNTDIIFPSRDPAIATAGIAASLAVLVIIIIVFIGVLIVYYRRKRKEKQRQQALDESRKMNGGLPENHVPPRSYRTEYLPMHPVSLSKPGLTQPRKTCSDVMNHNGNGLYHRTDELEDKKLLELEYNNITKTTAV